jgi:hypothetical protein
MIYKINSRLRSGQEKQRGITLLETLVVVSIVVLIMIAFSYFQSDVFKLNKVITAGLNIEQNSNKILKPFIVEVRSARVSQSGSFPISVASTSTFEFYSDIDDDGIVERIRYFLEDNKLQKGITTPSGNSTNYNPNDEEIKIVAEGIINNNIPLFEYFGVNSTSTSLEYPISPSEITMVKVTLMIDENTEAPPGPSIVNAHAMLRNLRNN